MKKQYLVLNGPNINLTGTREPDQYGTMTLAHINAEIAALADKLGVGVDFAQTNHEGVLIDLLHDAIGKYTGIILNAGAYTHYSYAIRDAISAIKPIPVVEVHMSDIHAREEFRRISVIEPVCVKQICGFGYKSYLLALEYLAGRE